MINSMDKDQIEVTRSVNGKCQILSVRGLLVYQHVQTAKAMVNELFVETSEYILDFTETKKIDSTGFGLIFNIFKRKPKDARLVAVVPDTFIRELFSITKIDQILPVVGSVREAQELLAASPGAD